MRFITSPAPSLAARMAFNPWSWVGVALGVRLLLLLVMPIDGTWLAMGHGRSALARQDTVRPSFVGLLQRRTEWEPLDQDERAYDDIACNVATGRGFRLDLLFMINTPGEPTMFAGLAYPAFVGGFYRLFGVGGELPVFLAQIALHGLTAWFLFSLAARIAGPMAGALAGAYFSFHPSLLWLSLALMSEAIMIPLAAALLWLLADRRHAWPQRPCLRGLVAGLLAVALAQTRSTFAAFLLVTLAVLLWENRRRVSWSARLLPALLALTVFAGVTLPWAARNHRHWGRWVPFSTKSAMAYSFNHDRLVAEFGAGLVDPEPPVSIYSPQIQGLPDEVARADRVSELFREFVREKPGKFLGLCGVRFCVAFLPIRLSSVSLSSLVAVWYSKGVCLFALLALGLLVARRRLRIGRLLHRTAPVVALLLLWQALQTLAGPGMRHRMPAEPAWIIFFAVTTAFFVSRHPLARRWTRRAQTTGR